MKLPRPMRRRRRVEAWTFFMMMLAVAKIGQFLIFAFVLRMVR